MLARSLDDDAWLPWVELGGAGQVAGGCVEREPRRLGSGEAERDRVGPARRLDRGRESPSGMPDGSCVVAI
jgi:hypothetical protein